MMKRFLSAFAFVAALGIAWMTPGCGPVVVIRRCVPNTQQACYGGPAGTEGIGICRTGVHTCAEDGLGFGPCTGEVLPGTEICGGEDNNCDGQSIACSGNTITARFFSATPDSMGYAGYHIVRDAAVDNSGNIVLDVEFNVGMDIGGPFDAFTCKSNDYSTGFLKLNSAFEPIFATQVHGRAGAGNVGSDAAGNTFAMFLFEKPVTFAGESLTPQGLAPGNALVFSMDPAGKVMSRKQLFCNDNVLIDTINADPSGDFLLSGHTGGNLDLGGGVMEYVFLGRFDASGNHIFSKQLSSSNAWAHEAQFDPRGDILLHGNVNGDANFGGETIQGDGDEFFVAKLDPAGQHIWTKLFATDPNSEESFVWGSVAGDGAGNVYVVGFYRGGTFDFGGGNLTADEFGDAFLIKLDSDGKYEWGKFWGSNGKFQNGHSVAVDALGNVVVGIRFEGSIDFGAGPLVTPPYTSLAVAKFTSDGSLVWTRQFYGQAADLDFADRGGISIAPSGEIILVGQVGGDVDFGAGQSSGDGVQSSVFAVRLAP